MLSHRPQLPTLSPENHQLLLRYFASGQNLESLISEARDLIDILQWLLSPEIAPWVALLREQREHTLRIRIQSTLSSLLDKPASPIEARRTATTLLRALQPPRPARTHTGPRTRPRSPLSEPSGEGHQPPTPTNPPPSVDDSAAPPQALIPQQNPPQPPHFPILHLPLLRALRVSA